MKFKFKKVLKLIIFIFLFFIILQVLLYLTKNKHDVSYEVKTDDMIFKVEEHFINNSYHIKINNSSYVYSINVPNDYHKNKKIVSAIYYYKVNDDLCIYPVLDNSNVNIICSNKEKVYSYSNSSNLGGFISLLKDKGYSNDAWSITDTKNKYKKIEVYPDNIANNTYIYIWKYNGFYSINKDSYEEVNTFKNDTYVNDLGILVDKYYVIPDYDERIEFNKFYVYDVTDNSKKTIKLKNSISFDSYINGVFNNKIYLFDKDSLKQYEINPKSKSSKRVGTSKEGLIYNDKWEKVSVYDLRDNDIIFKTDYDYLKKIVDVTSFKYIYKYNDIYYYMDSLNNVYLYDSITNVKVLLFNMGDLSYISNVYDDIYFVLDDTLYFYNINSGIKKIISYNELSFNSKNRIAIYRSK